MNLGLSMVTAMLISRFRTLEEYGTYSQLIMVGTIASTIFMMGLSGSINYFLPRAKNKNEQSIFLSNFYTVSTIISIFSSITLLIVSPSIAEYFDNPIILSFVYVLAILPWLNIVGGSIDNVFVVLNKIKMLSFYRIGHSVSTLIVVLLTVFLEWSFEKFLFYFIGVQVIYTIAIYIIIGTLVEKFRPRIDIKLIREIIAFSFPLGIAYTVGTFQVETDKLMIGYLYDTETLAIYTNAAREMPITIVVASIVAVITPSIVRFIKDYQNDYAVKLWRNATAFSYIFLCFFAAILFAFAPEIISILYSDKYLKGVEVFRISSIKILLQATNYAILLIALGRTKYVFYSSILALVLNVLLNYLFYLFYGINGFAIATLLSTAIIAFLQLYYSSINVKIPIKSIFLCKEMFL
ncbi:oligosaccharide flippase family protein, partial [Neobacillus niacini]|uniref:lipopolysaccharide biosynthesis protein n=1 Tax=Neobacillus niacini TaxID=86668 RepID=UPI003002A2FC